MDELSNVTRVKISFEPQAVTLALSQIVSLKTLRPGIKESKKYAQILSSIRVIGLVEAPVVTPNTMKPGEYFLLDGHLRVEALSDLGISAVECVVSTDDEAYTYNKRINRIAAVQEHRMIKRAIERGVPEERIAEALGLELGSVRRRSKMLNGICPDAVEFLKDTHCPLVVFDTLRRMAPIRQIEAAELMLGQNNFSGIFAKALLAATPEKLLVQSRKTKPGSVNAVSSEQISRMERELASLQNQVKSVEETYGIDNLHLTVARGYIRKLLTNARVTRWLSQHRHEYLTEFQSIAEIEAISAAKAVE
jgi:RepB plasmid partitioning protein